MVSLAGESDVEELECTAFTQSSKIARYGCRMRPEKWDMRSLDLQLLQAALLEINNMNLIMFISTDLTLVALL